MPSSNHRRRRSSGVLAEAMRKDLERDANGGTETDAPSRRERRNSAAFRRASFQAVAPAAAAVNKLGGMAMDEDERQKQQQGLSRRKSSSNLARRGSSSALRGGASSRRASMSKKKSAIADMKQAAKSSSPTAWRHQHPSGETDDNEEDDDDALIMACVANMESRSKPGHRPSPPTASESKSMQSTTTNTNAERGKQGALAAFLESQKQERAALAYFQAQQAEQAAITRAMQSGADKVKRNSDQPSFTSTNTAPREEKPISSELAQHRARIKAAQEREDNAYTGVKLEEHKAKIASRYGGDPNEKSVKPEKTSSSSSLLHKDKKNDKAGPKKTGETDIRTTSSKGKKSTQPLRPSASEQTKTGGEIDPLSPRTISSEAPSPSTRKVLSRSSRRSEEATKSIKQPEKKKRELLHVDGSLLHLDNLPSGALPSSPSKTDARNKQLTAYGESVSSSSRRNVILAASRSIRSQGYDELSESHRSLTSNRSRSDILEEGADLEGEKQRAIRAIAAKGEDGEIDDLANLINDVECVFNTASSLLSTQSITSGQGCANHSDKSKKESKLASPPPSPPPLQDLRKYDRGEHFLSSDDPILFFEGLPSSSQEERKPHTKIATRSAISGRPSKGLGSAIIFADDSIAIVKIPHLSDMEGDEKLKLWFSQEEHRRMRKKTLKDIYALHRDDTEHITCPRGLEYTACESEWHHRKTNKDNALSCVLEEQSRQRKFQDYDAAEMATIYTIHSQVSQFYAKQKGEEDERYVDQNVRDGKKANGEARNDSTENEKLGQSNSSLQEVPGLGFLPNFFSSLTKGLSSEQVQAERDAGSANNSSNLICDFGERRRASGLSITDEDKRVVGGKAA